MPWRNDPEKRRQDAQRYGAAWRRARDAQLRKANWRCEIRIQGVCIGAASEVDHVDGAENDPQHRNLRAACKPCHDKVTAQQGGGFRSRRVPRDPDPRPRTEW
jgi:5-methylcytosine-specific restriction endonuclease McrA